MICSDIDEIIKTKKLTIIKFKKHKKRFLKVKEIPIQSYKKKVNKKNKKNNKKIKKNIHLLSVDESKNLIDLKLDSFFKISRYLLKSILPACYWSFMGIIELSQFISIGFTLVAISSKVFSLLKGMDFLNYNKVIENKNMKEEIKKINNEIGDDDEDLGEHLIEMNNLKENLNEDLESIREIGRAAEKVDEDIGADYAPKDELNEESYFNNKHNGNNTSNRDNDNKRKKANRKIKKNKTKNAKSTINDIFGF